MSELSKLVGKGKKVKIDEVEIEIKPLSVRDMPIMMKLGQEGISPTEQAEAMRLQAEAERDLALDMQEPTLREEELAMEEQALEQEMLGE